MFLRLALLGLAMAGSTPVVAGAGGFSLVNGTESSWQKVAIRRAGSHGWTALSATPAPGTRHAVPFNDPDCAFDIQVTVGAGEPLTWAGVNLCDVKSVTLKNDSSAGRWVDYDAE